MILSVLILLLIEAAALVTAIVCMKLNNDHVKIIFMAVFVIALYTAFLLRGMVLLGMVDTSVDRIFVTFLVFGMIQLPPAFIASIAAASHHAQEVSRARAEKCLHDH